MSNGLFIAIIHLLLFIVDFVLNTLYSGLFSVIFVFMWATEQILHVNMTEKAKKAKRTHAEQSNQTVVNRGIISANWEKFLSSNLISDTKTEKPAYNGRKDNFSGTFRRARKMKSEKHESQKIDNAKIETNNCNSEVVLAEKSDSENNNRKVNQLTKFIAMDCEMVGIGYDGNDHMLARVSLVNKFGDCIYDKFVKPREEVIDYRTSVSGVRKEDLVNAEDFVTVQKEVAEIMKGRVLVGHSLKNDMSVLFLSHPKRNIRDTSKYKPFRKITKGSTPSLKRLSKEILGIDIQHGEHSSVEDAKAAMQLYCTVAKKWEMSLSGKRGHNSQ